MEVGDSCSNDIGGSNRICWGGDVGGGSGDGIVVQALHSPMQRWRL